MLPLQPKKTAVDTMGELFEAHARREPTSAKYQIAHAERKCVEKTLDEEARARVEATYAKERAREEVRLAEVQAELAETRLRKERAENALADLAESRAKRRRVESEASS